MKNSIIDLVKFSAAAFSIMLGFAALIYVFTVSLADNSTVKSIIGVVIGIVLIAALSYMDRKK